MDDTTVWHMQREIWTEWLPEPVVQEITGEENERFVKIVEFVKQHWQWDKDKEWPDSVQNILQYYPLLFKFLESKRVYDLSIAKELIEMGLEIVFASKCDAPVLVRYADLVSCLLCRHKDKWKGKLRFTWRPFYDLCQQIFVEDRYLYYGEEVLTNIRQSVFCLVLNCCKYFPSDAFFEIWTMLKPVLTNFQNVESFIALGWLATFLPSQVLDESGGNWDALMRECIEAFGRVSLCDFWLSHWFDIFSRLAKYDEKGLIAWNEHTPKLFTAFLECFDLPIGTATGELKYSKVHVPRRAEYWFPANVMLMERSAAKCIVFMLRNDRSNTIVLSHITKMIDLFEQFCHPSNGGAWTSMLANFLKHLVKQLMKVISTQDKMVENLPNMTIPKAVQRKLVECLMKMASRGQFSKDKTMRGHVAYVLRDLSYLEPELVLPLVYNRFVAAIGSPHAPSTLGSSTHAFALCIRPMLMHGLHLADMDPHEAALRAVAQAMIDVLPGLDANDSSKTGTVFRFYASVFFSIPTFDPALCPKNCQLPFDIDLWVEEYLSRIFVLLESMEGPEARTDQSHTAETTSSNGTFLSKDVVFFGWCLEGFLMKLPPSMQVRAIKRAAGFLLSSPCPRTSEECALLCTAMAEADSDTTIRHLITPLIQLLLEELPPLTGLSAFLYLQLSLSLRLGDGLNSTQFTRAFRTRICWYLHLLVNALMKLSAAVIQNMTVCYSLSRQMNALCESAFVQALCEVIDRSVSVTDREIQDLGGTRLVKSMIYSLLDDPPLITNATVTEHLLPSGIARWVGKEPEQWSKLQWHVPTTEQISAAETLVERYLTRSIGQLEQLLSTAVIEAQDDFEDMCASLLSKIIGVLSGTEELLIGFAQPEAMQKRLEELGGDVTSFCPAGAPRNRVGVPGTKERLCDVLAKLCPLLEDADPTILASLLKAVDLTMNIGSITPPDDFNSFSDPDDDGCKAEGFFTEPAIAHPFVQSERAKPMKRRPYYQALVRIWDQYFTRRGDAAYMLWHSSAFPTMTIEAVPPAMGQLMEPLFRFATHPYEAVADDARHTIEKIFRRYLPIVQLYTPLILRALTRLPIPTDITMQALAKEEDYEEKILRQMEALMQTLDVDTAVMKSEEGDMSTELSQDSALKGAVLLMSTSFQAWTGVFRIPEKTARMICALIGGRKHKSLDTQAFVVYLVWVFLSRFISPPYIQLGRQVDVIDRLRKNLCQVGKEGVLGNWKFALLANVFLLAMLPRERRDAVELLEHFLDVAICELPLLRKIGLRGIYALLQPVSTESDATDTSLARVAKRRLGDEVFVKRLVQVLIHDHSTADNHSNGESGASRGPSGSSNGSFEESLVSRCYLFVDRFGHWPEGETPRAVSNGTFKRTHADAIMLFGKIAPVELSRAMQSSISEFTSRIHAQNNEKHELSALVEIIAGLLASGAVFVQNPSSESSAWETWFRSAVTDTLGKCPLEMATGAFAFALRYAAHSLLRSDPHRFSDLIHVVMHYEEKTGTGQSTNETKKLTFLLNLFKEVPKAFVITEMPKEFVPLYENVLELISTWLKISFQSVRKVMSMLMVQIGSYLLSTAKHSSSEHASIATQINEIFGVVVDRFFSGVRLVQAKGATASLKASSEGMETDDGADESLSEVKSKIGTGVQFVIAAMHDPQVSYLIPIVVQLLSGLLQIQELGDPELKPLQMEAISSFASIKYIAVDRSCVHSVVQTIQDASDHRQWHTRGAALIFLQVFWFHHVHILTPDDSAILKAIVVKLMEDEKLEVKNTACSTLSGMIKGMTEEEQRELREAFLVKALRFYPVGRHKKKERAFELSKRHACILGLRALVMAHPYDIPPWMAEVLMAMIPAAQDMTPIKTTVTKTLGDFRTTHENESHEALRDAFDEDTWESIQAVGSQASYFT